MAALLESPPLTLSLADLAVISRQLADDVGRLPLRTEGFSVADCLTLTGNYLVEYLDGCLQVLPMPNALRQEIGFQFAVRLKVWSAPDPEARTKTAPFFVRVSGGRFREPDVCFMSGANAARRHATHWDGADLVAEIISESNRDDDVVTKRAEYAAAGVPEYWLFDPEPRMITLVVLQDGQYVVHGVYGTGQTAASVLLAGFAVDVGELFAEAARKA